MTKGDSFFQIAILYYYVFWDIISKVWKMSFVGLLFQVLEMQEIEVMEPKVLIASIS